MDLIEQLPLLEATLAKAGVVAQEESLTWPAAVGATQAMWRNTELEDWHSSGEGLHDGEMMRANAATSRLIHQLLVDGNTWEGIAAAVTHPRRRLPDGRSLRECTGLPLGPLRRGAGSKALMLSELEGASDHRSALIFAASFTLLSGSDWFGMPSWPRRVAAFCQLVENPEDPHWNIRSLAEHGPRPAEIADVEKLRSALLEGPDRMTAESAEWCVNAGIRYVHL